MDSNKRLQVAGEISERIFEDRREYFSKEFADHISNEKFRKRIKPIFAECIETVAFMQKVKEYAAQEIEVRLYRSVGFWVKTIIVPVFVTIITVFILQYLHLK